MASLASLIEREQPQLKKMLGAAFDIQEADDDYCRVITDHMTIHFYRTTEGVTHSSIELRSIPAHAVEFSGHLHTWLVLKSRGEEWPDAGRGTSPVDQLTNELMRLQRAIPLLRDDTALRDILLWEAGYMDGYADWD